MFRIVLDKATLTYEVREQRGSLRWHAVASGLVSKKIARHIRDKLSKMASSGEDRYQVIPDEPDEPDGFDWVEHHAHPRLVELYKNEEE